uniref:BSD domain-containing protein n=1 Tax=Quercus lobata TaxID=97700 RepID=A0A7N2LAT8_QUELO
MEPQIDKELEVLDPGPRQRSLLTRQPYHRLEAIWNGEDSGPLTCRGHTKEMANVQMQDNRVIDIIKLLRLEGLFRAPSREIDNCLISALVERWRPETHTFHLPHGEMTITLQDVEVIFGLPIDGDVLVGPTAVVDDGAWRRLCTELLGFSPPNDNKTLVGQRILISRLVEAVAAPLPHDATEMQIHRYAQCYILALIGDKLFMDKSGDRVHLMFLDFMRNLRDPPQYSWGSGCLAWLYRELCRASKKGASQIGGACTWVRVPSPKSRPSGMALVHYRELLVTMQPEQIVWQPYEAHFGHLPEFCVAGRDTWTARVPLVCFYIVERHHPDRVLRQFGLAQERPDHVVYDDRLHKIDLRGKVEKNWREEHRPYIISWEMRRQQLCHAPPQIGEMPRNHAYYVWYRPVTRKYVDRNSAKLDIMIQSHLALLAMLPEGSQAHNHVRRVLNNVAGLGGGPAVNEHANNGDETELAAAATPSTSAAPVSTPTRGHRATTSPSTSAARGRLWPATATPSTSAVRGRGRRATTPRVVTTLEMPPPIPQASPQPEVPSPIPYASPQPEVPSPSPPSQPNFDVSIDQNVTPPILPETPSYLHTGSSAPTPGLYIEQDYPPTASSSDPLGPPVGIDTVEPHTDVLDEHPPHEPSPPRGIQLSFLGKYWEGRKKLAASHSWVADSKMWFDLRRSGAAVKAASDRSTVTFPDEQLISLAEMELRIKLLRENSELQNLHKKFVLGNILTESEFWATRKKLLDGDSGTKSKQRVGFKSSMILDIKPMTDGRTNKVTFNLTPEIKYQIFALKPAVHRAFLNHVPNKMTEKDFWTKYFRAEYLHSTKNAVATAAEAAEDEELAIFLKDDDILANAARRRFDGLIQLLIWKLTKEMITCTSHMSNSRELSCKILTDKAKLFSKEELLITLVCNLNVDVELEDPRTVAEALAQSRQESDENAKQERLDRISRMTEMEDLQACLSSEEAYGSLRGSISEIKAMGLSDPVVRPEVAVMVLNGLTQNISSTKFQLGKNAQEGILNSLPNTTKEELLHHWISIEELLRHFWSSYPITTSYLYAKVPS